MKPELSGLPVKAVISRHSRLSGSSHNTETFQPGYESARRDLFLIRPSTALRCWLTLPGVGDTSFGDKDQSGSPSLPILPNFACIPSGTADTGIPVLIPKLGGKQPGKRHVDLFLYFWALRATQTIFLVHRAPGFICEIHRRGEGSGKTLQINWFLPNKIQGKLEKVCVPQLCPIQVSWPHSHASQWLQFGYQP